MFASDEHIVVKFNNSGIKLLIPDGFINLSIDEINELDKPLKYAKKKDIMPSDITGAILAKKVEDLEKNGKKSVEKKTAPQKVTEKKTVKKKATKTSKK